jgi:hypothetical protein
MDRYNTSVYCENITFSCEKIILWNHDRNGRQTDIKNIYGVLIGADIYGLQIMDKQLIYFISILESFLKNQLSGLESNEFKIINTKGKTLINIYLQEQRVTLNKLQCNYILNCYKTTTKEYTPYSFSKWAGIGQ